jgi:hypothetical protein
LIFIVGILLIKLFAKFHKQVFLQKNSQKKEDFFQPTRDCRGAAGVLTRSGRMKRERNPGKPVYAGMAIFFFIASAG